MSENAQPSGVGVSRRTVTKAMAWTIPTIAVAATVPIAAASGEPIQPSVDQGAFCKHPGNPKYYHGVLIFKNTTDTDITVTIGNMTVNGVTRNAFFSVGGASSETFTMTANHTTKVYVDAGLYDDSANGTASYTFSYVYNGETFNGTIDNFTIGSLPPCKDPVKDNPPHATSGPA